MVTAFNYLIESNVQTFGTIQEAIRRLLLDGLDVRVTPVSRNRALLSSHILDAIRSQYNIDPWNYLRQQGVGITKVTAISDEDVIALVAHRAPSELDDRPAPLCTASGGYDWHLNEIKAPAVWASMGGAATIAWKCRVGQIDTGFLPNPVLGFGAAGASPWLDVAQSANFFNPNPYSGSQKGGPHGEDPEVGPVWGHGSRIGATISGYDPANSFYGCAPKVPHTIVRICDSVLINDQQSAYALAIRHLVDVAKVDVINLSMGIAFSLIRKEVKDAIDYAYNQGVIMVCAGGQYVPHVVAPASLKQTIAVGGITCKQQLWANASRGPEIDWSAPAADIRRSTRRTPGGAFAFDGNGDGTSYATALSTGAAALWLTRHWAAINAQYGKTWRRAAAFKELGRATTTKPAIWGNGVAGTGILDILALVSAALPAASTLGQETKN